MPGLQAQLINPKSKDILRADVFAMTNLPVTKEDAFARLKTYAEATGFQYPEYSWEITPIGPKASVRGVKFLANGDKQVRVTYMAVNYFGKNTLLVLYVGCASTDYPTNEISHFLNSVHLK